jgi:hypothetical protein
MSGEEGQRRFSNHRLARHSQRSPRESQAETTFSQTVSGEAIPVLKEALFDLTLRWWALAIWVFVAEVTQEFIVGLDILRAYNESLELGHHLLRMGREKVTQF